MEALLQRTDARSRRNDRTGPVATLAGLASTHLSQPTDALIAAARRAAALAPFDRAALDVLSTVLVRLADLSRVEVARG
ncbi:hypothetical protein BTH42_19380 [Burkholderia sp. SRS-W-2-2016]|nr:hypothetical protein BTH42_19380 [Burkholderia sp. SRS-W-2-2016]